MIANNRLDTITRAALVWLLMLATGAATTMARDVSAYAKPTPKGDGYTIDYDALGEATDLSEAEKFQVARALRRGTGHQEAGLEKIAGLSAKCKIKKFLGIPDGADCTVTADPAATKVLVGLGSFALTNAICLVIDVEDGEITEPICDLLLEAVVKSTIEPVLEQCADKGQATNIKLDFQLVPPKLKPSASCG